MVEPEVEDVLNKQQISEVRDQLRNNMNAINCSKIFKDDPTLEFIGAGGNRCAFITNEEESILKIARNEKGVQDNRNASQLLHIDEVNEELVEETFARPKDVSSHGAALIQEEVDLMEDLKAEEIEERIDDNNSGQQLITVSQIEEKARTNIRNKLDEVEEREGIRCTDEEDENIGLKPEHGAVLVDLGECEPVQQNNGLEW